MITMLGVLRHSSDGAKVTFDQAFRAPGAELWDAVTNPDRLERWFARVDGDLVERGHFTIHLDGDDVPLCHLIECSPGRQFAFEWPMQQQTLVTVKVLPDGKHSRLELHHERLVPTSAPQYAAGWDAYFHSLADHLDGKDPGDWRSRFTELKSAYREQQPL